MPSGKDAIQKLAERLIAVEASCAPTANHIAVVVQVCGRLRDVLVKFAGVAGFRSLLARAMALATREVPALKSVQIQSDGSLLGFENEALVLPSSTGVVMVGHILELLVTFIGEPLTLRLVGNAWPDTPLDGTGDPS